MGSHDVRSVALSDLRLAAYAMPGHEPDRYVNCLPPGVPVGMMHVGRRMALLDPSRQTPEPAENAGDPPPEMLRRLEEIRLEVEEGRRRMGIPS